MADEKLNTGPGENISPEAAEPIATPEQAAASEPQQEQTGPAIPEPGDVVVSFDKINELMAEKRQNARAEVEKAETPEAPEAAAPGETPQPANTEEPKKPRRGRPPKAEKAATENQKSEKSAGARKGRPPKADKTAPDKPKPSKRDKVSRSDGKAPDAKEPIKPAQDTAPKETATAEQTAPEPTTPPRPVEEGKAYRGRQVPHGKQSVRKLMAHGTATNSIELSGGVKSFDRVARKWNVDYAFYKTGPDKYLLFFKAGQADAMTACFSEYSRKVLSKAKSNRVPIREQLKQAADQLSKEKPKQKERAKEVAHEDR